KIGVTAHPQTDPALVFSPRQLNAVVDAIHKRGLMVDVHATTPEGMYMSLMAGVDLIQHPEVIGVPITDEILRLLNAKKPFCSIHGTSHSGRSWEEANNGRGGRGAAGGGGAGRGAGAPSELRNWPKPPVTEKMMEDSMVSSNTRVRRD